MVFQIPSTLGACKPLDPSCVVQIGSIATSTASSSLKKQRLPCPSLAASGGPAAQEKQRPAHFAGDGGQRWRELYRTCSRKCCICSGSRRRSSHSQCRAADAPPSLVAIRSCWSWNWRGRQGRNHRTWRCSCSCEASGRLYQGPSSEDEGVTRGTRCNNKTVPWQSAGSEGVRMFDWSWSLPRRPSESMCNDPNIIIMLSIA